MRGLQAKALAELRSEHSPPLSRLMEQAHVRQERNADQVHEEPAITCKNRGNLTTHPEAVFNPANSLRLYREMDT